ncbi:hypothetical protein PENFLA_c099G03938, partial [Penicillium flavigenum]
GLVSWHDIQPVLHQTHGELVSATTRFWNTIDALQNPGPTARGDDALIRRKQPNLTDHARGPHPVFDRQYDSATFMKKLAVFLALGSHMNFLATWQIIGFQTTAYDAGTNCGIFWSAHSGRNSIERAIRGS